MVFSSTLFLLYFLPAFLLLYHLVPKNWKNGAILLASVLFYAWGAPRFIFVILASTVLDFFVVRSLHRSATQQKKKAWLILSISLNLGLLLYFKYANFFVENVNQLFASFGAAEVGWTKVALPIGISFYTFQTLTYAVDVYRGVRPPLKKVSDYLLYILSFPQMIAGPIVRFNAIAAQITHRVERIDDKLMGLYRFTIGLAKKVLIANVMGEQADAIFAQNPFELSSAAAWVGILAYTFQIYFDFSGYSDMAIGLGRIMGFRFPENFDSPYISRSITEFWRRWHITLGGFMRDYLYIPLGGNRVKSKARLYLNLWLVFLLSGLWHGASWNFVLWGAFHGLFLILDRLFLGRFLLAIGKLPAMLLTFFITVMGWVVFRIEDTSAIAPFYSKLFQFEGSGINFTTGFLQIVPLAVFFSFIMAFLPKKRTEELLKRRVLPLREHLLYTALSMLVLALCISAVAASSFNPFIYFRF